MKLGKTFADLVECGTDCGVVSLNCVSFLEQVVEKVKQDHLFLPD